MAAITPAYVNELAVWLYKGGIRNPKRHDWENVIRISAHPHPLDAKTLGEGVMLAQDLFKDGITEKFMAQAIKDRIGGLKPAEEFVADWDAEDEKKDGEKKGKKEKGKPKGKGDKKQPTNEKRRRQKAEDV